MAYCHRKEENNILSLLGSHPLGLPGSPTPPLSAPEAPFPTFALSLRAFPLSAGKVPGAIPHSGRALKLFLPGAFAQSVSGKTCYLQELRH